MVMKNNQNQTANEEETAAWVDVSLAICLLIDKQNENACFAVYFSSFSFPEAFQAMIQNFK